jgi:hypothetical protein
MLCKLDLYHLFYFLKPVECHKRSFCEYANGNTTDFDDRSYRSYPIRIRTREFLP